MRLFNRWPDMLHIEYRDRHAEHLVDDEIPLCGHGNYDLIPGDMFRGNVNMKVEPASFVYSGILDTNAEVEIHYPKPGHILVIINHADYVTAREKRRKNDD